MGQLGNKIFSVSAATTGSFLGDQCTGHGRVHVADNDYDVRLLGQQYALKSFHHLGGLGGMRSGANPEKQIWLRQLEIVEKEIGHIRVVMLSGVHQNMIDLSPVG